MSEDPPPHAMHAQPTTRPRPPVEYDATRRRLWLLGQRCHHGASGALIAGGALTGVLVHVAERGLGAAVLTAGAALMAHDWKDRRIWFERGAGRQP